MKNSIRPRSLLNVDANAKTVKGQKRGYLTGVLYLAPWKAAGINVCPMAEEAGCIASCLNTAGRGGIAKDNAITAPYGVKVPDNAIQRARIARTRFYAEDRDAFMAQLEREIHALVRRAKRRKLIPVIRLNGTSDIVWERVPVDSSHPSPSDAATIFDLFPDVQFYDYTKLAKRFARQLPANYHLSLSYSEASPRYAAMCRDAARVHGAPLVVVTRHGYGNGTPLVVEDLSMTLHGGRVSDIVGAPVDIVNGDAHDLRFLDPKPHAHHSATVVALRAKGHARHDRSGFVVDAA